MSDEVVPLDEHGARKARELTDRIRQAADDLWARLLEAHQEQAWADLGYDSWRDWARECARRFPPWWNRTLSQGLESVVDIPPELLSEVVAGVVEQERARIVQRRELRGAWAAEAAIADPGPDYDWERDRELLRQRGAILRLMTDIAAFPPPGQFLADHDPFDEETFEAARAAQSWLEGFLTGWEGRCPTLEVRINSAEGEVG